MSSIYVVVRGLKKIGALRPEGCFTSASIDFKNFEKKKKKKKLLKDCDLFLARNCPDFSLVSIIKFKRKAKK